MQGPQHACAPSVFRVWRRVLLEVLERSVRTISFSFCLYAREQGLTEKPSFAGIDPCSTSSAKTSLSAQDAQRPAIAADVRDGGESHT